MKQLLYFLKIRNNPAKSRNQIDSIHDEGLRRILLSAYENTTYYRSLFDEHNIDPRTITAETISRIPIMTKQDVREAGGTVHSRKFGEHEVITEKTGGSTGKPLEIRTSKNAIAMSQAAKLRIYVDHGYKLTQKICSFLFYDAAKKFYHRFGIHRIYSIPPLMPMNDMVGYLQSLDAEVLDGYPSRIASIARHVRDNGIKGIKPKLVFTNSETMQEKDRATIREVFVDPIDIYVSYEFKFIAWECEQRNGLHINEDLVHVEIVDPETGDPVPNGVSGEIVITGFSNEAMPFIRYNTEDVGTISESPCTCGRPFVLLKNVLGRVSDFIVLQSGERVLGQPCFARALGAVGLYDKVVRFQATQRSDGSIDLALDGEDLAASETKALLNELAKTLGTIDVRLLPASAITRTKRGKYRVFKSELS
jgi:phenylacetate-CoA ligase